MSCTSGYNGLIELLKNDKVDVVDILNSLLAFTGGTNISLFTKTGRLISTNDKLHCVSKFQRTRFVVGLDIVHEGVKSINPFLNAIEGILDDDIDGTSFIVNMSHEIRTPLNGVNGYIQLLSQTNMDKQQRTYTKSLMDCSKQLMEIINNILDASRLNSCKMDINESVFSIKEIESSVTNIISGRIRKNNQKLLWRYVTEVPEYVVMDKQKLIQIMINLISNASKYSESSGVVQVIVLFEMGELKIQVIDDGIGIPEDKQHLLFSPFSRLHPESIQLGSGLGLSICKRLAILLDGDLSAVSKVGKGSVFNLTLPYDTPSPMNEEIEIVVDKLIGINVCIINDKVDSRIQLMEYFETWSANAVAFATATELKHMSKRDTKFVDMIIVDNNLDGGDIEQIRICHPLSHIVIAGENVKGISCDGNFDYPLCKAQVYERVIDIIERNPIRKLSNIEPITTIDAGSRVLICEDVEYNRDILEGILKGLGLVNIDTAINGEDAIQLLSREDSSYDLIFLDIKMPRIDGYGVIEHINDSVHLDIGTVVVTTASVISGELERCTRLGVKSFLPKPISLVEVRRLVINTLNDQRI
jgi:signal transduction histidine kinase/CheY-like chemotaxis protein